jgi:uncharacterized protein (UPF0248 family)
MTPIHELLARIRWDPDFGRGEFELAYLDRLAGGLVRVSLRDVGFDPDDHFGLRILDSEGCSHSVPYHRIRAVYRDGQPIWQRSP